MSGPHQYGGNRQSSKNSQGTGGKLNCQTVSWIQDIRFQYPLRPEIFSSQAKDAAEKINDDSGRDKRNNPSQLRRFYDEIVMWEGKLVADPGKFDDFLPFIRMLNAKAAYAEGRKVVSEHFVCLMEHTLDQVKDVKSMTTCKLFWEAFMGFYKSVRPN